MDTDDAGMEWIARPRVALGLAAMTVALSLIAFFVMVVQESVMRGAQLKREQALGTWSAGEPTTQRAVQKLGRLPINLR